MALLNRVALRKAAESAQAAEATKAPATTKAAKAPKAPKSPKATPAAKSTNPAKAAEAPGDAEASKAPKKGRGMKGKKHGLPCYAFWTLLFDCQALAADGKANPLGLKSPLTDDEISKLVQEEYDGKCKEHDKAAMLRGLYNRGKINKQPASPTRLVGRFEKKDGKLIEVVTARRVAVVG